MADTMAGHFEIGRLEAATDFLPQGEIMEELEDDYILDGAVAEGLTVPEGPMAASFNIDEGIKAPTQGLPRPETIPKLLEDGYTRFYHFLVSYLGSIWRGSGSGSLISSGRVHNNVKVPDDQAILKLEFYIMEEVMIADWFRNVCSRLRRIGVELISLSDTHGWVFKHDCIVVKISDGGTWIKAEKGGESSSVLNDGRIKLQNDGGIKLEVVESSSHPKDWKDPGDLDSGRYSERFAAVIKLSRGKEKFTVKRVEQLLSPSEAASLDYSIFSSNCWQYAFSSAYNVLIWILENSEDEEVQGEIRQILKELKLVERPMPKDIFLALWNPSAPGSGEIIATYRQKLTGTLKGLPEEGVTASVRRLLVLLIQKLVDWRAPKREDMADDGESASSTTSSAAEPSVEDECGAHSIPVDEEYLEMMQNSMQPTQYLYSYSPPMMDSGPWRSATPSVEPLLRRRKKKLPPNSSGGPTSGSVVAQAQDASIFTAIDGSSLNNVPSNPGLTV